MAITGKPTLAYIGVEAPTPPNMTVHDRDPNIRDLAAYRLGDLWLNRGTQNAPLQRLWILTSKANSVAQWALIISGSGGPILTLTPDGGAPVNPVLGNITIDNTDGNIVLTNGGPGLILENFANSIFVQNNINTLNGNVLIGSTNPVVGPQLVFLSSTGGGVLAPSDNIGRVVFEGFDGAAYQQGAAITSVIDAAGLVANMPANLAFWTKPNNANPIMQRMEIRSTGEVFIGLPDSGPASLTTAGGIITTNGGIIAGAISNTPPNTFSSVSTLLSHVGSTAVAVGDILGGFSFLATTAPGIIDVTSTIGSVVGGAGVAANNIATDLRFSTRPAGVVPGPLTRMVIASTGEVTINPPDSGNALTVLGNIKADPGNIATTNSGIIAGAISNTPPNSFSSISTLLTHAGGAAVAVGDILGGHSFLATTAPGFIDVAAVIGSTVTAGPIAAGQIAADLVFDTRPAGVRPPPPNELLTRMVIASTGAVTINPVDVAAGNVTLTVNGSVAVTGEDPGVFGTAFTGTSDLTANGAGVFTILSKSANPLNSSGFIKIFINATPYFIPIFSATAP